MDIAEALKVIGENSLTTDKALLKLCEALTNKVNTMDVTLDELGKRVMNLQEKVRGLQEKADILLEMFNTRAN